MCIDEEQLSRMPDDTSFQHAAALPLVTLTAWQVTWWDVPEYPLHQAASSWLSPAQNLVKFQSLGLAMPAHPCYRTGTPLSHKSTPLHHRIPNHYATGITLALRSKYLYRQVILRVGLQCNPSLQAITGLDKKLKANQEPSAPTAM